MTHVSIVNRLLAAVLVGCRLFGARAQADDSRPSRKSHADALIRPLVTCYETAGPVLLDGVLDDDTWTQALAMAPFLKVSGDALPSEGTRAFVGYDRDHLYVAVEAFESLLDPLLQRVHEVTAEIDERDGPVWSEESIELFFQPDPAADIYYHMAVNMIGTIYDARCVGDEIDGSWDAPVRVATHSGNASWIVEMAVPLAAFGVRPAPGVEWGFNICRNEKAQNERSCWSPTGEAFHVPERFGRLRFGSAPVLAAAALGFPAVCEGTITLSARLSNPAAAERSASLNLLARYGEGPWTSWPVTATLQAGQSEPIHAQGILTVENMAFKLEATPENAAKVLCFRSNRLAVQPETLYEVSAMVKTADLVQGSRPLALSISSYDADGKPIRTYEPVVPMPAGTSDWQSVVGTWRSPAGAADILLWFVKWGNSGVTGTVLVDDIFMARTGTHRNLVPNGALDSNEYQEFRPWKVVLPRVKSYARSDRVTLLAEVGTADGLVLARSAPLTTVLAPSVTTIGSSLVLRASRAESANMHVFRELHVVANGYLSLPLVLRSSMLDQLEGCQVAIDVPACMRLIDPRPHGRLLGMTRIEGASADRRRYQLAYERDQISPARVEFSTTRINYLILVCDGMPVDGQLQQLTVQAAAGGERELPREYPLHILPPLQWKRPRQALIKNWACSSFYRPLQRMNEQMQEAVHDTWGQSGFNAVGSIATQRVARRLGLLVRGHLPSVPGGGNFPGGSEFLAAHPEARALAFDGAVYERRFCPTFFLSADNTHFQEVVDYLKEHARRYDILDWDLEVPVLRDNSVCVCERCLAELRKRTDVPDDADLTSEALRSTYKEPFTDFRCRQNAEMAVRYRRAIKEANPSALLTVYSGYKGDTRWRYGVDWAYFGDSCDLVWAGYGRPVRGIRDTHAAIGDTPFICGELAWFGTYPYDCAGCRTVFFRRLTDGGAGIMSYFNWIVDGRFYDAISAVASVAADHPRFFGFDQVGEGLRHTLKARHRRDDALAAVDGEAGHGDLAVLLADAEWLIFVFNESREPVTRTLTFSSWDETSVAVDYVSKAVYRQSEISLDIPARDVRILQRLDGAAPRDLGAPVILGPSDKLAAGGARPLIAWQGSGSHPGLQRFTVEVSDDRSFPPGGTHRAVRLARTSWAPSTPLTPGRPCFARVIPEDAITGAIGPASDIHEFTVPVFHQVRGYPQAFSPDGDGKSDVFAILGQATADSAWTVTIRDGQGQAVRTLAGEGVMVEAQWDGSDDEGRAASPGHYTWAIAGVGSSVEKSGRVELNMRVGAENPTAGLLRNFVLTVPAGAAELERDYAVTVTNSYSLRLRSGPEKAKAYYSNYGGGGLDQTRIPVIPGSVVRFSARLKTDLDAGEAGVALAFFTNQGSWSFLPGKTPYGENSDLLTGVNDWTEVGITQEVPPDADSAVPFLRIGEAVGTVWFDDFRLQPVQD